MIPHSELLASISVRPSVASNDSDSTVKLSNRPIPPSNGSGSVSPSPMVETIHAEPEFEFHDPRGYSKSRRASNTSSASPASYRSSSTGALPMTPLTSTTTPARVSSVTTSIRSNISPSTSMSGLSTRSTSMAMDLDPIPQAQIPRSMSSRLKLLLDEDSPPARPTPPLDSPPRGRPTVTKLRTHSIVQPPTATSLSRSDSNSLDRSLEPVEVPWSPAAQFLSSLSDSTSSINSVYNENPEQVEGYVLGRILGTGGSSVVREATHRSTGEVVACKIIRFFHSTTPGPGLTYSNSQGQLSLDHEMMTRLRCNSSPPPVGTLSMLDTLANITSISSGSRFNETQMDLDETLEEDYKRERLNHEISLWSKLDSHPNLIPLINYIHQPEATYIFMPLCSGGNLLSYVNDFGNSRGRSRTNGTTGLNRTNSQLRKVSNVDYDAGQSRGFELKHVKHMFQQIASAVQYLHTHCGIIHRDLKLENVFLDNDGNFRLGDFGLAEYIPNHLREWSDPGSNILIASSRNTSSNNLAASWGPDFAPSSVGSTSTVEAHHHSFSEGEPASFPTGRMETSRPTYEGAVGSLKYASPELLRSSHPVVDSSVDIWALGCILYALVDGRLPFDDDFEPRLRLKILKGEWSIPKALRSPQEPPEAEFQRLAILEVLKGCLQVDLGLRWSINQVMEANWFRDVPIPFTDSPLNSTFPVKSRRNRSREGGTSRSRSRESARYNIRHSNGNLNHNLQTLSEGQNTAIPPSSRCQHSPIGDRRSLSRSGSRERSDRTSSRDRVAPS